MATVGFSRVYKQSLQFTVLYIWLVWMIFYSLGRFHNYGEVYVAARYYTTWWRRCSYSSSVTILCSIHRTKMDQRLATLKFQVTLRADDEKREL